MTDLESDTEVDLAAQRKSRDVQQRQAVRLKKKLQTMLDEEDPATLDLHELQGQETCIETALRRATRCNDLLVENETDDTLIEEDEIAWDRFLVVLNKARRLCQELIALRVSSSLIASAEPMLDSYQAKVGANPNRDYSEFVSQISDLLKEAGDTLRGSTIPTAHELWKLTRDMTEKLGELRATEKATPSVDTDRKDFSKAGASEDPYKLPKIHLPKFRGGLEQWQSYWGRFQQAVHDNPKLGVEAKMAQLLETIEDPTLSEYLNACNDGTGKYPEVIAYLKERFDQPKELHGIYCQTLASLQPIKGTQADIQKLADTLFAATSGLTRLGQDTIESIATSLALPAIPRHLRTEWDNKTEAEKQVPSVFELIKFLRRKATTAKREQKAPVAQPSQESKKSSRQQAYKQKGSVHLVVSQPAKQDLPQQTSQPSNPPAPSSRQRGNQFKTPKGSQYPPCKHVCKLCNNNHYAYSCTVFENMSVAQRLDHVRSSNLCQNCLKPGHASTDCRSEYRCRVCRGEHNTMVHLDGSVSTPQHVSGNTNHVTTPTDVLHKGKLLMTCQVVVTGPTGKSLLVRALLDSGSTVSLITKKVAKNISLRRLGTSMTIASLGDVINEPANPTASVTISSLYRKDWSAEVVAGIAQTDHRLKLPPGSLVGQRSFV